MARTTFNPTHVETSFLLPVRDDAGRSFAADRLREFESLLLETCGGFTRETTHARGAWWGPDGRTYGDTSVLYRVAVRDDADSLGALHDLLQGACVAFHQQAIYWAVRGGVVFVTPAGVLAS